MLVVYTFRRAYLLTYNMYIFHNYLHILSIENLFSAPVYFCLEQIPKLENSKDVSFIDRRKITRITVHTEI